MCVGGEEESVYVCGSVCGGEGIKCVCVCVHMVCLKDSHHPSWGLSEG